jgi:hypothetical protein
MAESERLLFDVVWNTGAVFLSLPYFGGELFPRRHHNCGHRNIDGARLRQALALSGSICAYAWYPRLQRSRQSNYGRT